MSAPEFDVLVVGGGIHGAGVAQQGGGIQTGSEFNGICEKKKVTPGGIFTIAEGCTPDDTTEF